MAICFWLAAVVALATPATRIEHVPQGRATAVRAARAEPPPMARGRRYASALVF
jgi:hypothetical protein